MTQKTYVARNACDFYFLMTFCDLTLTLTLLGKAVLLMQYLSWIYKSTLCKCELLEDCLTDPGAKL